MLNVYWNLKTDLGKEKEVETEQKSSETETETEVETEQKRSEQNICFPDSVGLQSQSVAVEVVLLFFSQKKFQVFNANTSVHFFLILFQTKLIWNSMIFWDIWSWINNLNVIC